jgi:NAD(P)-dependent dehydrogenase (short-subunit alcohol dehydrogenase family)
VVLACRDLVKANAAVENIRKQSNNRNVFFEQLDLADLSSVRAFAERFKAKFDRLDILINNAGIFKSD